MLRYRRDLKPLSRDLRSHLTDAEQALWHRLRRKQLHGVQFYRQRPLADFIADFYAPVARLVVEVDGAQHFDADEGRRDEMRSARLAAMGIVVKRYDNRQVLTEIGAVVEDIERVLVARLGALNSSSAPKSPPAPLFQRGEKEREAGD